MESDEQREKDIKSVCDAILELNPEFYYNSNGADESICPFCREVSYRGDSTTMDEIKHDPNCAYLIAKDLNTNL